MAHNGYENYETWSVCLWLDNEEGSYYAARSLAKQLAGTHSDSARADAFKEWLEESMPDVGPTLWADLLNSAFGEVDWQEVADHYHEEVAEEEETDKEGAPQG